jgi:cysteine-rich repeat protein
VLVSGDCGNNIEESDEQCDDGNSTSGDGCNSSCQTESADGSVCGNGTKEAKEQCDDGNNTDGDACTSICQNTAPNTGPIATLFTILLLSLGGVGYYFYRKRKIVA